jgi:hypothetical protein
VARRGRLTAFLARKRAGAPYFSNVSSTVLQPRSARRMSRQTSRARSPAGQGRTGEGQPPRGGPLRCYKQRQALKGGCYQRRQSQAPRPAASGFPAPLCRRPPGGPLTSRGWRRWCGSAPPAAWGAPAGPPAAAPWHTHRGAVRGRRGTQTRTGRGMRLRKRWCTSLVRGSEPSSKAPLLLWGGAYLKACSQTASSTSQSCTRPPSMQGTTCRHPHAHMLRDGTATKAAAARGRPS